jgi:hypothetical protein
MVIRVVILNLYTYTNGVFKTSYSQGLYQLKTSEYNIITMSSKRSR